MSFIRYISPQRTIAGGRNPVKSVRSFDCQLFLTHWFLKFQNEMSLLKLFDARRNPRVHSRREKLRKRLFERLESRQLLAADNTFAVYTGTLDDAGANGSAHVRVTPEEVAATGGRVTLGFHL